LAARGHAAPASLRHIQWLRHSQEAMSNGGIYKWLMVAMLWCVCFVNYADRQLIFTVFPLLSKEFRLSNAALSMLSASFMCTYALFGPVGGLICDRVSRRTLILGALIFWSLTALASAFVYNYAQLVCCVALGGLGEAFYFPAAMSMIADYHAADTRSRAMSLHQSSVYIGSIAGGTIAGYLGQLYSWRTGFRWFGSVGIALGCVLWLLLKEPQRGQSDSMAGKLQVGGRFLDGFRDLASNRVAWILVAVFMGANFVAMIFTVWLPTFLYRTFHMSLTVSGFNASAYLQIASVVGVLCGGTLADGLVRRRRGEQGARMRVQALGLFCGVPFLFLSGWVATAAAVMGAMIGFGFFKGVYDSNLWAALYDVTPIERRGVSLGIMNSLGWLGGAIAQLCIGFASDRFGMNNCLSATAVVYLGIAIAMALGARRLTRQTASGT
jgi:MFS family permease